MMKSENIKMQKRKSEISCQGKYYKSSTNRTEGTPEIGVQLVMNLIWIYENDRQLFLTEGRMTQKVLMVPKAKA